MGDILSNVSGKLYLGGMYIGDVRFAEGFISSADKDDKIPETIQSNNISWRIDDIKIIDIEKEEK